jgi:deoxyribodipyrimidine photolyase-related protein
MTLRLILGDQLNEQHTWFRQPADPGVLYVLMEIRSEVTYARHHVQKVLAFFSAMRLFAERLRTMGHRVAYVHFDDPTNQHSFADNCAVLIGREGITRFEYLLPDEYRVDQQLRAFAESLSIEWAVADTAHFLTQREDLARQFAGKKTFLMEAFYRKMRQKHQILMESDGSTPLTGRWNYDAENRKKLPANVPIPPAPQYLRDVRHLADLLIREKVDTIGSVRATHFDWPLTRAESLDLLAHFVRFRLRHFGQYQDALTSRDWLLFHSRLSFSLNVKLISPLEVVQAAIDYWQQHQDSIDIATLEGFVRQIIGWREYMRGIYWAKMPEYAALNYFDHTAALPGWYWTGQTRMRCLSHTITQSLERGYAHHIQRLMVTGNFALLLGVHPDEVDAWYLGIYVDALEWVEITNTRGMSQFADGGIVGTKPYVSSANYLHKMGDYCAQCHYRRDEKTGPNACPFNALYWDFYDRHRPLLGRNPRIGMMYQVWDKMTAEERVALLERAAWLKANVEVL